MTAVDNRGATRKTLSRNPCSPKSGERQIFHVRGTPNGSPQTRPIQLKTGALLIPDGTVRSVSHSSFLKKEERNTFIPTVPVPQSCAARMRLNKMKYSHIILYSKAKVNPNITRLKVNAKTIKEALEDTHGKVVYESDSLKGKDIEFDSPQQLVVRYRV